jgi:hypothetical protein
MLLFGCHGPGCLSFILGTQRYTLHQSLLNCSPITDTLCILRNWHPNTSNDFDMLSLSDLRRDVISSKFSAFKLSVEEKSIPLSCFSSNLQFENSSQSQKTLLLCIPWMDAPTFTNCRSRALFLWINQE